MSIFPIFLGYLEQISQFLTEFHLSKTVKVNFFEPLTV